MPSLRSSVEVARNLLQIGALKFNFFELFTWTSGIKSPIYCDNRRIYSFPEVRELVVNAFVERTLTEFPQVEVIAAVATGGIPIGVLVADRLKLPFIYIRSEEKKYGLKKQIEGHFEKGQKAVLIEDLISTGGSSRNAIDALQREGLELISLISIMTYGFQKAKDLYDSIGAKYESISDLDTVLEVALEQNMLTPKEVNSILRFRENPKEWENGL